MASRLERMPVRPLLESTAPLALCSTAADTGANGAATGSVTASGDQTAASTGALTKSEYGQLAQTGIGISLACAAILLLAGLAYAMKTFVQYKRETSED